MCAVPEKLHYTLSPSTIAAYDRWKADKEPTPEMQALMDTVADALMQGLYYNVDVYAFVVERFDFTPEELQRDVGYVERGVVGMELYYARKRVDARKDAEDEAEARRHLALVAGMKLGELKFAAYSLMRNCVVEGVYASEVIIDVTQGKRRKRFHTTARAILMAREQMRVMRPFAKTSSK